MNSDELLEAFRADIVDAAKPYLWSDKEAFRYMADAHRMFARLVGGFADNKTDDVCLVPVTTGVQEVTLHPTVLRVMSARMVSNNAPVKVINETDVPRIVTQDYGRTIDLFANPRPGDIIYLLIGQVRGTAKVFQIPEQDDQIRLSVYRLPLEIADGRGKEITDIDEEHHYHLIRWMEHLAYLKQDAEVFNKSKADEAEAMFRDYCAQVRAEWERYMHKTRVVQYGGIGS